MDKIQTIKDIISLWPSRAELVRDLCAQSPALKFTVHQVNKWAEVGSIRAQYHHTLILAAQARGYPVSADLLTLLHSPASPESDAA